MVFRNISMACAAALVIMSPTSRASADAGDFVAGAVVGVVGSALVRNSQRKQTRTVTRSTRNYNSAARAENRQIQTSLNYFGFPAGTPDGVMGRNSRAAVSTYQAHMGYAATGQLTQFEKDFLLTSYNRALAGGAATNQLIATNPQGSRGLLLQYRDQQAAGGSVLAVAPAVTPAAPATTTVVVAPQVQPAPTPAPAGVATLVATPAQPGAALPSFFGSATETTSLTSHCNQISLLTSSNGGFATQATMTDANFALNEQFCLARTYAVSQGEDLISKVQGFTPEQIAAQCKGFGATLSTLAASVSQKPRAAVSQDVSSFVQTSGMAPAQLAGTSKICLSVGYRTDDMNVAIGSALLLSVLGEAPYGELLGHHLAQGIGAAKRPDLAKDWYESALSTVESGVTPVFAPGQPERTALLRKATLNLGAAATTATVPQVQPVSALPTFKVEN